MQGGGVEGREEGALHGDAKRGVGGLCDGDSGCAKQFREGARVAVVGRAAQAEGSVVCEARGVGAELRLRGGQEQTDDSEQSASVVQEEQSMPPPEGQIH